MRPVKEIPAIRSAPTTARVLSDEQITALRALDYEDYLRSRWWSYRRNHALHTALFRCQRCESKRELQVHHLSYDRLGCEADDDLEVLCRGCHLGEHYAEVQSHIGVYTKVLSEVIAEGRVVEVSDVIEEAKQRCVQWEIPLKPTEFSAAVSRVMPRIPFTPDPKHAELFEVTLEGEPLSRAEAAAAILKLGASSLMRHIPEVRPLTQREFDKKRALEIVAQAILAQVDACEAAERPPSAPTITPTDAD